MTDPTRPVPTYFDAEGYVCANSVGTPKDNKVRAAVCAPPPNVVPILFIPGIMGSNLRATAEIEFIDKKSGAKKTLARKGGEVWRVDDALSFGAKWSKYGTADRQLLINKDVLEVDPDGKIELREEERQAVALSLGKNKGGRAKAQDFFDAWKALIADKRRRGWGTVSWEFYGPFLNWLEESLQGIALLDGRPNPKMAALLRMAGTTPADSGDVEVPPAPLNRAMIERLLEYQFPIWAVGYNWAASNLDSGEKLAKKIAKVIDNYHGKRGQRCTHVIVVTHSMGGLVARAAAMKYGAKDSVAGIVHGVMPTHGAAAMYKRAVGGFGNEGAWFMEKMVGSILGVSAARALGRTARETAPVLAFNPGPLELAPNHRYNGGKPWLIIKDKYGRQLKALPESGNPYAEIYRRPDVWWRMVNPEWLNPAGLRKPAESLLQTFLEAVDKAEEYHRELADENGFHPETYAHYAADDEHAAWGELIFEVVASEVYVPPPYTLGLGAPVLASPRRVDVLQKALQGAPETWQIQRHDAIDELMLRDTKGGEMRAHVRPKADPGDSTVPARASAGGVDRYSRIVCTHKRGYEHDASYKDDRVRQSVLDAIVRLVQMVPVLR